MTLLTVPAPRARLASFLAALPEPDRALWSPPKERGWAGTGVAWQVDVEGSDWRITLAQAGRHLFDRLQTHALFEAPHAPRLVGGLAFSPSAATSPTWQAFGAGRFVLPRWTYSARDGSGALTLAVDGAPRRADVTRLLDEAQQIFAALEQDAFMSVASTQVAASIEPTVSRERWRSMVDEIRAAIGSGALRKVVAARYTQLQSREPFDALQVLARLDAAYPDCFRFGIWAQHQAFVGATPERLVARRGRRVFADALAGSIAAEPSQPSPTDRLQASDKDRHEHALVIEAIAASLRRWTTALQLPTAPGVLALRHVLHLHTPIIAELDQSVHVLDLVEALHPTPAVGGLPRDAALRWIAEREHGDRGWYAGPVGWFDGLGDGEFAVGIRSALLRGCDARVYAGAGIVADSNADAEYEETELKQRAMLRALGQSA